MVGRGLAELDTDRNKELSRNNTSINRIQVTRTSVQMSAQPYYLYQLIGSYNTQFKIGCLVDCLWFIASSSPESRELMQGRSENYVTLLFDSGPMNDLLPVLGGVNLAFSIEGLFSPHAHCMFRIKMRHHCFDHIVNMNFSERTPCP